MFSMRIRLANRATARKKQTINTGIIIITQASGSSPPKHSAWNTPVPKTPTMIHQSIVLYAPTAAW
jgi:hypothetical protein